MANEELFMRRKSTVFNHVIRGKRWFLILSREKGRLAFPLQMLRDGERRLDYAKEWPAVTVLCNLINNLSVFEEDKSYSKRKGKRRKNSLVSLVYRITHKIIEVHNNYPHSVFLLITSSLIVNLFK